MEGTLLATVAAAGRSNCLFFAGSFRFVRYSALSVPVGYAMVGVWGRSFRCAVEACGVAQCSTLTVSGKGELKYPQSLL